MSDHLSTQVTALLRHIREHAKAGDIAEVQLAADSLLTIDAEALTQVDPAITRNLLDAGAAVLSAGDVQRAEALMHKGVTALSSNAAASKVDLLVPLNNLIALYDQVGDHQRASAIAGYMGGIVEQLDEPVTGSAVSVLLHMAQMYEGRGQLGAALVFYRPIHQFMMTSRDLERDTVIGWVKKYMQTLMNAERYDAVKSLGYEVVDTSPDDAKIQLLSIIAEASRRGGDAAGFEEALEDAVAAAKRLDDAGALTGRIQMAAGAVYHNLAVHYFGQQQRDRYPRGQELIQREIAILLANGRGGSAEHAGALGQLAVLTDASGDNEGAERLYVESIGMYETAPDTQPSEFADFLTDLGMLRLRHDRGADAIAPLQRALELRDATDASADRRAEAASNLATAYFDAGDLGVASSHFNRAIDLRFAAAAG